MSNSPIPLEHLVKILKKDLFFVQIGSNDGISHDPIYEYIEKYNWSGLMIEPQKEPYQKLYEIYKNNSKIKTLNCAVYESNQEVKLYRHMGKGQSIDNFTGGSTLLLRKDSEFNENVYEIVEGRTFESIMKENNIEKIDLLVIDTEGYDTEIIKTIDFNKFDITAIFFERWEYKKDFYISKNFSELEEALEILHNNNYSTTEIDYDIFAIKDIK